MEGKKTKRVQWIGNYFSVLVLAAAIVAVVFYNLNLQAAYFKGQTVGIFALTIGTDPLYEVSIDLVSLLLYAAIACIVLGFLLSQYKESGTANVIVGILKIAVPVLLLFAALTFGAERAEGLAFILASNDDVKAQFPPEYFEAANQTIYTIIVMVVGGLLGLLNTFMREKKAVKINEVKLAKKQAKKEAKKAKKAEEKEAKLAK